MSEPSSLMGPELELKTDLFCSGEEAEAKGSGGGGEEGERWKIHEDELSETPSPGEDIKELREGQNKEPDGRVKGPSLLLTLANWARSAG